MYDVFSQETTFSIKLNPLWPIVVDANFNPTVVISMNMLNI